MWKSCLLLFSVLGCSLWRGVYSGDQLGPEDCTQTINFNVTLFDTPPGTLCIECRVGNGPIDTDATFSSTPPIDESKFEDMDGVLVVFATENVFGTNTVTFVSCQTSGGSQFTIRISLLALAPPIINGERVVNEDGRLRLTCGTSTSNTQLQPQARWITSSGVLIPGTLLEIENITRDQGGTYTCVVFTPNSNETANSTVEVVVQFDPDVTLNVDDIEVPVGIGDLVLSCSVDALPLADNITWTHNDSIPVTTSDPRITIDRNPTSSTLTVNSVEADEGGMYTCTATNDVGPGSATATVLILLPPGPPTNLMVTEIGETFLNITWVNPSFDGGSPIDGFRAQLFPLDDDSFSHTFPGDMETVEITLDELNPNRLYIIRLFVFNEVELEGEMFDEITNMTQSLRLPVVRMLSAMPLSSTEIRVTWQEPLFMTPLNTTAPPSGYRVTYAPTNGSPTVTKVRGADELSINLVDLEMGTEYDITVVGINTAGDGEAASTSASTNIDPPSVPRNVAAMSSDPFTIILTWIEPETNGGRPLDRYLLTIAVGSDSPQTVDVDVGEGEKYRFESLEQDTTYQITIKAITIDVEDDNFERSSDVVTVTETTLPVGDPQVPDKPSVDVTDTTATLSWNNPGGFPTEYRLEVKQHLQDWSSDGVLRINTSELTHNLTGLDTLTRYDARVLSVNFNGPSDFSPTAEFATVGMIMVSGENGENETVEATSGETITLSCTLKRVDSESTQYQWSRVGGVQLPEGSDVTNNGQLTIPAAEEQDSGEYICTANGVEGRFTLSITDPPTDPPTDPDDSESSGVSTTVIIIAASVGSVALLLFFIVVAVAVYCLCFRGSDKEGSPHRRTYSFRPKHWTEASGSHSMPREQQRKEVTNSFHMPDDYTGTSSFNTTDRIRRSPSPPSHSKAEHEGAHAGAEPTTSFQLSDNQLSDNSIL